MKKKLTGKVPLEVIQRLVSTPKAAEIYGVSQGTLRNWRSAKKGPAYYRTDGGEVLYDPEDLMAHKYAQYQRIEYHSGENIEHNGTEQPRQSTPSRSDH